MAVATRSNSKRKSVASPAQRTSKYRARIGRNGRPTRSAGVRRVAFANTTSNQQDQEVEPPIQQAEENYQELVIVVSEDEDDVDSKGNNDENEGHEFVDMTQEKWWTVDSLELTYPPERQTGATALIARCIQQYQWDIATAFRILKAYRQFLSLKKELNDLDATILYPPALVEKMWHVHMLDVRSYVPNALAMFGSYPVQRSDEGLDEQARNRRIKATREAAEMRFEGYDERVWLSPRDWRWLQRKFEIPEKFRRRRKRKGKGIPVTHMPRDEENPSEAPDVAVAIVTLSKEMHPISFGSDIEMRKVLSWYAEMFHPDDGLCLDRFGFAGVWNKLDDTAQSLNLKDGDRLEMYDTEHVIIFSVTDPCSTGTEFFHMPHALKMVHCFEQYIARKGLPESSSLRFTFCGEDVSPTDTAHTLGLEDNDRLYVELEKEKVV